MKNLVLLSALVISTASFSQETSSDKKPKLEIRSSNSENQIHRKTNDHKAERIELKKEDRRDHTVKPTTERHHRPHLDGKKEHTKKERVNEHKKEQRHEKNQHRREQKEQKQEKVERKTNG
jgi:hypothetical protein